MPTLGDMAKALNRPAVYLRGLQTRFELPLARDNSYSDAYFAFLRTVVFLRTLNVPEDRLRDLWRLEMKLLQLLHVDTTGSPTWFLDAWGQTGHPRRRLLLSNYDLEVPLPARGVQLGLNLAAGLPELFAGKEMGEDALRMLGDTLELHHAICGEVAAERPSATAANRWARRFK